jgi:hypothetical protein
MVIVSNEVKKRYLVKDDANKNQILIGHPQRYSKWAELPENFDEENYDCYTIDDNHVATFDITLLNQKKLKKYTEAKQKILQEMSYDIIEAILDGKNLKEFKDKKDAKLGELQV